MTLSPDELIVYHLKAAYDSRATDASAKRKHTDLLDEYGNEHVRSKWLKENTRIPAAFEVSRRSLRT